MLDLTFSDCAQTLETRVCCAAINNVVIPAYVLNAGSRILICMAVRQEEQQVTLKHWTEPTQPFAALQILWRYSHKFRHCFCTPLVAYSQHPNSVSVGGYTLSCST